MVQSVKDINRLSRRYLAGSIGLMALLAVADHVLQAKGAVAGTTAHIVVCTLFSLVVEVADIMAWRKVAMKSPDSMPTFYTAVSGFRMLLALATMLAYYLAAGKAHMMAFVVLFLIYYVVLLAHHAIFFSRTARRSGQTL